MHFAFALFDSVWELAAHEWVMMYVEALFLCD